MFYYDYFYGLCKLKYFLEEKFSYRLLFYVNSTLIGSGYICKKNGEEFNYIIINHIFLSLIILDFVFYIIVNQIWYYSLFYVFIF